MDETQMIWKKMMNKEGIIARQITTTSSKQEEEPLQGVSHQTMNITIDYIQVFYKHLFLVTGIKQAAQKSISIFT